ncbi:hypothetical protein N7454_002071 [Penicillium verhagenii]|nr:hypothetical protein N7454_002071 [Penicillium verhagenii]
MASSSNFKEAMEDCKGDLQEASDELSQTNVHLVGEMKTPWTILDEYLHLNRPHISPLRLNEEQVL